MPTDNFASQTQALRALGGRRVWSLMISLFGDLAQKPDQSIDGPVLSAIMGKLDVRPEATRVALHRLRNDGWITSRKSGRISRHSLSDKGRAECAAASPRIYANPDDAPQDWQLILTRTDEPEDMGRRGFIQIEPRLYAGPPDAPLPDNAVAFEGGTAPDWLRRAAEPAEVTEGYIELHDVLQTLQTTAPEPGNLTPIEVAALRCLIVHNWRRLVLRHPPMPAPLVRADWPGHLCQIAVQDLLTRFPRPRLEEIDQSRAAA